MERLSSVIMSTMTVMVFKYLQTTCRLEVVFFLQANMKAKSKSHILDMSRKKYYI